MKRAHLIVALVLLAGTIGTAEAKKNNPNVRLAFVPQQTVAAVTVDIAPVMRDVPVTVIVADARGVQEAASIGRRTDDGDDWFTVRATNDVVTFVQQAIDDTLADWRVATVRDPGRTLEVGISRFEVEEANKPVGAVYRGRVGLAMTLEDGAGRAVWTGSSSGEATRYGRKFSAANTNEVLSDALLEALAAAFGSAKLHEAWAVEGLPPDSRLTRVPDSGSEAMTPARLLAEIRRLMDSGLSAVTIEEYVAAQTLDEEITARDLETWKEAGIAESVIRTALRLPVR